MAAQSNRRTFDHSTKGWRVPLVVGFLLVLMAACDRATITAPVQAREATGAPVAPQATRFSGRVVGIADGDTMTVLVAGDREVKVRFAEIDAPEKGQPWGNRSKQTLSALVFNKDVSVEQTDVDRWGRIVGRVFVDGRDVNREMVAVGGAWVYRRYMTDRSLLAVEARAQEKSIGLWSMPESETVAPWDWRNGVRRGVVSESVPVVGSRPLGVFSASGARSIQGAQGAQGAASSFSCSSKTRCDEMISCAEAEFYLTQCRLDGIDGDRDGEPCEKLCGTVGR